MLDISQLKLYDKEEEKKLYQLPPKEGSYYVLNTRTTGLNKEDQIMEVGIIKMEDGDIDPLRQHFCIKCSFLKDGKLTYKPGIENKYMTLSENKYYHSEKENLEDTFKQFENSIIFAHNAIYHMNALNKELKFWGLNEIPIENFRCSMLIFLKIIGRIDSSFENIDYISLDKCVEYFGDEIIKDEDLFLKTLYDSEMTALVINNLYQTIKENHRMFKDLYDNWKGNFKN